MDLRKTPEQQEAKQQEKARKLQENAVREREEHFKRAWHGFWASPAGEARRAYDAGAHVFQFSIDVMNQDAIIVAMVGSTTNSKHVDPSDVLNSVCREGWELVNGDFVFVTTGQQSRDKFMSSGQNVAIAGTTMGYYLSRRNESHRHADTEEELRRRLRGPIIGEAVAA